LRARGADLYFVAILPAQATPRKVRALAEALGIDEYAAGQILRRPTPVVRHFAARTQADEHFRVLQFAGIRIVGFHQRHLDALPAATPVRELSVEGVDAGTTIRVTDFAGLQKEVPLQELQYAVAGQLERRRTRTMTKLQAYRDAADELVLERKTVGLHKEHQAPWIIDLYGRIPAPLRLIESQSELRTPSSAGKRAVDFTSFVKWLEDNHRRLVLERGFKSDAERRLQARAEAEAKAKRREEALLALQVAERVPGAPWPPPEVDPLVRDSDETEDSAPEWDEFSARSFLIWKIATAAPPAR
jgi:hypothetical protein